MRLAIIILLFSPYFGFAQQVSDSYDIYSKYLKLYQDHKAQKINFVIRESTDYGIKYPSDVNDIADIFKGYLKGDKDSKDYMYSQFSTFIPILKNDSLWGPLLYDLDKKMKKRFIVKNEFSSGLQLSVLRDSKYHKYFHKKHNWNKNWKHFYNDYPSPSLLVDFSEITFDGERAVFYFSGRCGPLCGTGDLIFFYKVNSEWKYLQTLHLYSI